ncbi:hypothetical protein Tsubulata_046129, partial [Turnera subulata]
VLSHIVNPWILSLLSMKKIHQFLKSLKISLMLGVRSFPSALLINSLALLQNSVLFMLFQTNYGKGMALLLLRPISLACSSINSLMPLLSLEHCMEIQALDISSSVLPVWIQLRDVPLELCTREGLSYLASALGKPSSIVNVCVEVDFAKALVPSLEVDLNDEKYTIGVSYSWKPSHCINC